MNLFEAMDYKKCGACKGHGKIFLETEDLEVVKGDCPVCNGLGKVDTKKEE